MQRPSAPDAFRAALRLYQHCHDQLKHVQARIEGNVVCDFRLDPDARRQAIDLLQAQADLDLACRGLAAILAESERHPHANVQTPEAEEPASA
jgi:hypothetical protein